MLGYCIFIQGKIQIQWKDFFGDKKSVHDGFL